MPTRGHEGLQGFLNDVVQSCTYCAAALPHETDLGEIVTLTEPVKVDLCELEKSTKQSSNRERFDDVM